MDDMNFKSKDVNERKKPRTFWRNFGIFLLAFLLSLLTLVVVYR